MKKIRILISSYLNSPYENRINTLYCVVYSILSQTYDNFEIIIHHDGPLENKKLKRKFNSIDKRISFINSKERKNNWGFHERYSLAIKDPSVDYILFTNDDNYYMPNFLETLVKSMEVHNKNLSYCNLIHNERDYGVINAYPEIGHVDLGCFIASQDLIKQTPWTSMAREADGIFFKDLTKKSNPIKINKVLFVHN